MASCSTSRSIARSCMDVLHFPDDARPPWLVHPVLALGNFDGLHRGHLKIIERVQPRRRRARRHADGDDLRSASAARRAARQGAAAADDEGAAARGARPGRHRVPSRSCGSRASCRSGIRRRSCARCSSTGCASRKCGSARISCSATTAAATSPCCARSASATASAPRRSIRFATRNSSSAARASAGWWPKAAWTKRARCSGIRTIVDGTVVEGEQRGRELGFPTANLRTDNELMPPHGVYATTVTIDGIVHRAA